MRAPTIQSDIPVPRGRRRTRTETFLKMAPGDSFLMEPGEDKRWQAAASQYKRLTGGAFNYTVRGNRFWRITP